MPLSVQDRLDIMDLIARSSQTFDRGDAVGYSRLFTEGGIIEGGGRRVQGRADIQRLQVKATHEQLPAAKYAQHWTSSHVIEGGDDSATMRCFFNYINVLDEGKSLASGLYEDRYAKVDEHWLIAHRVHIFYVSAEEIAARMTKANELARRADLLKA
jgi:hypothetical protein